MRYFISYIITPILIILLVNIIGWIYVKNQQIIAMYFISTLSIGFLILEIYFALEQIKKYK